MHLSNRWGADRRSSHYFACIWVKVEILQVAVKALLVYASDQLGKGMKKKIKVSISMKVFTC
jgi:hypothetical protein